MSLTVASAALDVAWLEFGAVALTAGTLNTLSACIDHVGVKLNRGAMSATSTPSDAQVAEWIARAKQELAEASNFTFLRRFVTTTFTAGTYRYALPPDYIGGDVALRDKTNDRMVRITSNHQFDLIYPDLEDETSGDVRLATIKNLELWVGPPPGGSDVFELEYRRSGDDITAATIAWLPERARFLCCDFAIGEAFMALDQFDKSQLYMSRWEIGLRKAKKSDGKRRWATQGFQARSVFQA